jgi:hypothetical protein
MCRGTHLAHATSAPGPSGRGPQRAVLDDVPVTDEGGGGRRPHGTILAQHHGSRAAPSSARTAGRTRLRRQVSHRRSPTGVRRIPGGGRHGHVSPAAGGETSNGAAALTRDPAIPACPRWRPAATPRSGATLVSQRGRGGPPRRAGVARIRNALTGKGDPHGDRQGVSRG